MNFLAELVLCRAGGISTHTVLYTACEKTDCPGAPCALRSPGSSRAGSLGVFQLHYSAQQPASVANTVYCI